MILTGLDEPRLFPKGLPNKLKILKMWCINQEKTVWVGGKGDETCHRQMGQGHEREQRTVMNLNSFYIDGDHCVLPLEQCGRESISKEDQGNRVQNANGSLLFVLYPMYWGKPLKDYWNTLSAVYSLLQYRKCFSISDSLWLSDSDSNIDYNIESVSVE